MSDRLATRRWRKRNPALSRERARAWVKAHREQERERHRRYDAANREKRRQAMAKSRAENPDHHRQLRKQWYWANPAKFRDQFYRYYEAIRNPCPDTAAFIKVLLGDPCSYCGTPTTAIDHITPRSHGGQHDWANLTSACGSCNPSKGNKPLLLWLAIR